MQIDIDGDGIAIVIADRERLLGDVDVLRSDSPDGLVGDSLENGKDDLRVESHDGVGLWRRLRRTLESGLGRRKRLQQLAAARGFGDLPAPLPFTGPSKDP